MNPADIFKFLTAAETQNWLDEKISNQKIEETIRKRKKSDFIYLNLKGKQEEIVEDFKDVSAIREYFLKLEKSKNKSLDKKLIFGEVAYSIDKKIRGQVVIIKDKKELIEKYKDITNKILVAIQTIPHYIPYVRRAKAIITDEGGITCHAAIIAREFKIPCIMGTKNATKILKEGDYVEIDTQKGIVKILRK